MKKILSKFVDFLSSIGEINFENIFIDGTKIETYANKYSFVWRKAIEKSKEKLQEKIRSHFYFMVFRLTMIIYIAYQF